jgi:5-methylcytosine-specific restriction endonuclease McrA
MKKHTKVYLEAMNYDTTDFIPCEMCGSKAVDIHHIQARGMGGSKSLDVIDNLVALCRTCHHKADFGSPPIPKEYLREIHARNLKMRKDTKRYR